MQASTLHFTASKKRAGQTAWMRRMFCVFCFRMQQGSRGRIIWAVTCDFQQCGILTSVDSDEHVQPPF